MVSSCVLLLIGFGENWSEMFCFVLFCFHCLAVFVVRYFENKQRWVIALRPFYSRVWSDPAWPRYRLLRRQSMQSTSTPKPILPRNISVFCHSSGSNILFSLLRKCCSRPQTNRRWRNSTSSSSSSSKNSKHHQQLPFSQVTATCCFCW